MSTSDEEEPLLRSVALQNAQSILQARERAESELLEAREALRESQERLTAALAAASTATFRWVFATGTTEWDEMIGPLFGVPPAAGTHRFGELVHILHAEDRPVVQSRMQQCRLDGSPFEMEFRVIHPGGALHWLAMKATVVSAADGTPIYMTGACRDVTRLKAAEEALREETRTLEILNATGTLLAGQLELERVLQAVTDAATDVSSAGCGAFFYNATNDGGDRCQLCTVSGAPRDVFERFGQPRASALFAPTFRGAPPIRIDDLLADPRSEAMGPNHGLPPGDAPVRSYLAVAVRSRSGEVLGGLFFGHPDPGVFTERAERLVLAVAGQAGVALDNARLYEQAQRAAAERKALLDSERAARAEAERMSDAKDDFLATLSHELRTPLNAILGWAQVLRMSDRKAGEMLAGLETIERNARVQAQLIDDLLDMSRINSGKLRLDVQSLHPLAFIDAAIETVTPAAIAKGIRVERLLDPAAGPISGDPGRLQQVVWNLLSNAIKFTPRGGTLDVLLRRAGTHAEIAIADSGIGIQPELMPHLFERFRQGDASTTRKYGGLGLGLSLVKRLVELHGGTVGVESPGEGMGTTVTVHLPLAMRHRFGDGLDQDRRTANAERGPSGRPDELAGVKVVIVDDRPDARDLIARVLEQAAAVVLSAATAEEAIGLVELERPDVLVSDIGMPDVDGYELLRRVRALGPDRGGRVPAIALTAFARTEDRTRALRAGFIVHVAKPVEASELVAAVASVAGRGDAH
jgi:signal transduction histidine kinase/ActR/RegA family two-component response regulator